jgi:endonuclease YncB( thermonuclease family)
VVGIPVPKGSIIKQTEDVSFDRKTGTESKNTKPLNIPSNIKFGEPKPIVVSDKPGGKKAVVTFIPDGDGLNGVYPDTGDKFSCRMHLIDAPETAKNNVKVGKGQNSKVINHNGQEHGNESRDWLKNKLLNKEVSLTIVESKKGREFCQVMFEGEDVSLSSLKAGWSHAYSEYIKPELALSALKAQQEAKDAKSGLWSALKDGKYPQYPANFRRDNE